MAFFSQLFVMLWKNGTLQKRKICVSIFEILLPGFFAALLLLLRHNIETDPQKPVTTYDIKNVIELHYEFRGEVKIAYAPQGGEVERVMTYFDQLFSIQQRDYRVTLKGFTNEEEMESYFANNTSIRMGIVFRNIDDTNTTLPQNIEFAVRPNNFLSRLRTNRMYPKHQTNVPRESDESYGTIVYIQRLVSESLMKYWLAETGEDPETVNLGVYSQRMAYPPYIEDPMITVIQSQLPFYLVMSFILSVIVNTKTIVYEKERKLKESMKLMGLKSSVYWLSWFVTFYVYLIPVLVLYAVFIGVTIFPEQGPILRNSDTSLIFVFLLLYSFSLITFCFMVSTFVQRANVGAALAGILFYATYAPYNYISNNYHELSGSAKLQFSLLFNCAMGLGSRLIGMYEGTGEGLLWSNFNKPATVDNNLSMLECMVMLVVDTFIHLLIFWYLENVRPGEFGVPKPFYFCFTPSYWFGTSKKHNYSARNENEATNLRFEKEPTNLTIGIQINDLRKDFGKKTAVQGLTLNMYEGQISVLLGHNGAGKTTTMSMLTGFIPPTSGTAIVNGYDITKNIDGVRSSLGLCPQHNILFDTMTVREHLIFFARLKGASSNQADQEIDSLVTEVGLDGKLNYRSENLSGGEKRKLSVAIALIAGSKVVILDEPSSGMDPAARRQTWNVLQNHREGRTMVLTTHYMDEADVLGDRIAIMAEGVVKCCGSSMFLKKLYGAGYHLVVVKNQFCDVDKVTQVIKSHIENAKLETIINQEITYLLPDKETAKFPDLFRQLEAKKNKLDISSFGTSATTMEEVFLKVGDSAAHHDEVFETENDDKGLPTQSLLPDNGQRNQEDDDKGLPTQSLLPDNGQKNPEDNGPESSEKKCMMNFNMGFEKRTGVELTMSKMYAVFVKRALYSWRNRVITLVQLLLPVIFTALGLAIDRPRPLGSAEPPLTFDLSKFEKTFIPTTPGLNATSSDVLLESFYCRQFGKEQTVESFSLEKYSTYDNYVLKKVESMGIGAFNKRVIVGLEVGEAGPYESVHAISHYNGQPYHAEPIGMNYLMNALLQFFLNSTSYSLQSAIHPMPLIPLQLQRKEREDLKTSSENDVIIISARGFTVSVFISFGMAFLTTLFIYYLIKERQFGAKHLQVVSGVDPFSYWIPTFLWDFITYLGPSLLLLVVFACYSKTEYVGDERPVYVILLLVLFGWSMLPFMYAIQFVFNKPPTGVTTIIMLNIVSGLVCILATYILSIPALELQDVGKTCENIFMLFLPNYGMAQSFLNIYVNYHMNELCGNVTCTQFTRHPCCKAKCEDIGLCIDYQENYLATGKPGIGAFLISFIVQGIVFFAIILLVEYKVLQKIWYSLQNSAGPQNLHAYESRVSNDEDSDVAAERQRITSTAMSELNKTDSLILKNLIKQYGSVVAVDHICVGIPQQECFGLLGQNGAGKTTTFKMLTGDLMASGGKAYLSGVDIFSDMKNVQANMGYCPQFDALIDQMTGRETLTMYARLRGVPEKNIPEVVKNLIDILMLESHADKLTEAFSGGNKRKLSTAIALVGDPHFIMLDEPSAGMDPKARRQLWNVLSQVRASGRTLILTSHSMEESDALCTRIAIMVNGRFVCLGSPQHLKNKFGQGYTLIVQLGSLEDGSTAPIQPVIQSITEKFPETKVFDDHQGYVHFQVPDSTIQLADVFSLMESTKVHLNVRDYSVHQTTLEQVFLTFTRSQFIAPDKFHSGSLCHKFCSCMK